MTQSISERAICWVADRIGICWLSLLLWEDGVMGRRYMPVHRCHDCDYCGKHQAEARE